MYYVPIVLGAEPDFIFSRLSITLSAPPCCCCTVELVFDRKAQIC